MIVHRLSDGAMPPDRTGSDLEPLARILPLTIEEIADSYFLRAAAARRMYALAAHLSAGRSGANTLRSLA